MCALCVNQYLKAFFGRSGLKVAWIRSPFRISLEGRVDVRGLYRVPMGPFPFAKEHSVRAFAAACARDLACQIRAASADLT